MPDARTGHRDGNSDTCLVGSTVMHVWYEAQRYVFIREHCKTCSVRSTLMGAQCYVFGRERNEKCLAGSTAMRVQPEAPRVWH